MNYYGDHGHGYQGPGAENPSTSLFPDWDQTYDSRMADCSLNISHNTSVSDNFNDYSLSQYNNPNNVWPSLPPEEPFFPEDLLNIQIQRLDSTSPFPEGARERTQLHANFEDSLAVSPPVAERRIVDPDTLSPHSNIICNYILHNMSPNFSFDTSCPMSPEDNRLSPGTEDNIQEPNDQGLGLTKDGCPRKRRPKKNLRPLSEEEKRTHKREINRGSTARYRRKEAQERNTLEQQLQLETERNAALEQLYQSRIMELTAIRNEFNCSSLYLPQ